MENNKKENKNKTNNNNNSKQQVVETFCGYFLKTYQNQTANANKRKKQVKKNIDKKHIVKNMWKRFVRALTKIKVNTCTANAFGKNNSREENKCTHCMHCSVHACAFPVHASIRHVAHKRT